MPEKKPEHKRVRTHHDFLIPAADYLARHPNFRLVGREAEIKMVSEVLIQEEGQNNLIVTGDPGVGVTSLVMGLEASKDDPSISFDMAGKNYYWLDTDSLFASGDAETVRANFLRVLDELSSYSESVLVIQNAAEFVKATNREEYASFMNALVVSLGDRNFQAIFECRTSELEDVYGCHPYLRQLVTVRKIEEPSPDTLKSIVEASSTRLEEAYGIPISPEAISTAIKLTQQYRIAQISQAQPDRTLVLLGLALAGLRQHAHTRPPELDDLEHRLAEVTASMKNGSGDAGLSAVKISLEGRIKDVEGEWKALRRNIRDIQQGIHKEENEIELLRDRLDEMPQESASARKDDFNDVAALEEKIAQHARAVAEKKATYAELVAQVNAALVLTSDHILTKFSEISGLPVSRLDQDEISRLRNLNDTLLTRVTGQDDPVMAVTEAVRIGRLGLKKPDEPMGSFMFLGPSGAGKTELSKSVAYELFGDEKALQRYDMSKYNVEGGVEKFLADLTKAMRERPYCVNLFDEIEKGPHELLDLFLPIMDEGRLIDRLGVVTSFGNSVNIVTSNIGQNYFYDKSLTFEQASEKAMEELRDQGKGGYRNESLSRFTGIYCFHPLDIPQVKVIVGKRFQAMNGWLKEKGLHLDVAEQDIEALCRDRYVVNAGARSVLQGVKTTIAGDIAKLILENPGVTGVIKLTYDPGAKSMKASLVPAAEKKAKPEQKQRRKRAAPGPS